MNELNDLHDDDLRQLLPTLDHIEPAPPDLVERLWHELQPLLDDDAARKVATLLPQRPPATGGRHRWTMFAAAAAVVAVFAAGVVFLTSQRGPVPDDTPVADRPSASTDLPEVETTPADSIAPTTVPAPATVEAACEVFRRSVAELVPFDSLQGGSPGDVEPLTTWVAGLGTLLADIDRIGRPADSADQYLSIQLLRTALRTAIDDVEAGNDADAATALSNAQRHFDASQQGASELTGCLIGD